MSWIDQIQDKLPDCASDIKFNLNNINIYNSFDVTLINGCALAAALLSGNKALIEIVGADLDQTEKNIVLSAVSIVKQNNTWDLYLDMINNPVIKSNSNLRMNIISSYTGNDRIKFLTYCLCAHVSDAKNSKTEKSIKSICGILDQNGYTFDNFREIGKIISVIFAIATLIN